VSAAGPKNVRPPVPVFWLVTAIVLLLSFFGMLQFVLPVFAAMFADFGSELPAMTRGILRLSDEFRGLWWGGKLLVVGFAIVRLARHGWPVPSRRFLKWMSFMFALALLVMLIGMALPILELGRVAAAVQ